MLAALACFFSCIITRNNCLPRIHLPLGTEIVYDVIVTLQEAEFGISLPSRDEGTSQEC